jgi:hypothetical protein
LNGRKEKNFALAKKVMGLFITSVLTMLLNVDDFFVDIPFIPGNSYCQFAAVNAESFLWLGDPTLRVWIGTPQPILAEYPECLPASFQGDFAVTVLNQNPDRRKGFLVSLSWEDSLLVQAWTDSLGVASLPISWLPPEETTLELTITGGNCLPHIAELAITAGTRTLEASYQGGHLSLSWEPYTCFSQVYYKIYSSPLPYFNPNQDNLLAVTTQTSYDIPFPDNNTYFRVVAILGTN